MTFYLSKYYQYQNQFKLNSWPDSSVGYSVIFIKNIVYNNGQAHNYQ